MLRGLKRHFGVWCWKQTVIAYCVHYILSIQVDRDNSLWKEMSRGEREWWTHTEQGVAGQTGGRGWHNETMGTRENSGCVRLKKDWLAERGSWGVRCGGGGSPGSRCSAQGQLGGEERETMRLMNEFFYWQKSEKAVSFQRVLRRSLAAGTDLWNKG